MSVIKKHLRVFFRQNWRQLIVINTIIAPKLEIDKHDQDVMDIMKLISITEFDDGNDKSAFLIDLKLLSGFLGPELGSVTSDLSNNLNFGFEGA